MLCSCMMRECSPMICMWPSWGDELYCCRNVCTIYCWFRYKKQTGKSQQIRENTEEITYSGRVASGWQVLSYAKKSPKVL